MKKNPFYSKTCSYLKNGQWCNIKKTIIVLIIAILTTFTTFAQKDTISGFTSDLNVFDRFGNKYSFNDITKVISSNNCTAGFFNIDFTDANNQGFNDPTLGAQRRAVACQVFSDLSQLLIPALDPYTNTATVPLVNIELSSPTGMPAGALGGASSYYIDPNYMNSGAISGITEGEVWKTINGGINSYMNFNPNAFYHGFIQINFTNFSNWHYNLSTNPTSGEYDLYTVLLHEAIHTLGFNSLLNSAGGSNFGGGYYSRYDTYLKTLTGTSLVTNTGNCYTTAFNTPLNVLTTPCGVHFVGSTLPYPMIYTPNSFASGSSLSHIDPTCGSGLQDVMTFATGLGIAKRHPLQEEVSIFCDLGYNTTTNYGTTGSGLGIYFNYTGCANNRVAGVHDFHPFNSSLPYEINQGGNITISDLLQNDEDNGATPPTFNCAAIVSPAGGSLFSNFGTSISYTPPATFVGMAVLRYVPVGANGRRGNITYVYINVMPINNTPSCNLVIGGDFESITDINGAPINNFTIGGVNNSPDMFNNNLAWGYSSTYGVGCNTITNPNPHDFPNKHRYIGIAGFDSNREGVLFKLSSPMIQGHTYAISFWAAATTLIGCPPVVIQIVGSSDRPCLPTVNGISLTAPSNCGSYTYTPVQINNWNITSTTWTQYTYNYTVPVGSPDMNFIIASPTPTNNSVLVDDISVIESNCLCTNGTELSGTLTANPASNAVYIVNSALSINGNISIVASELKMSTVSSITVLPGATLNILGSHLYACSDMWNGIIVQPGGRINILSTTYNSVLYTPMIEDALVAVNIESGSTLTTNILNVENATFNRNQYDIKIEGYTPYITPYPFSISNSVFTCRDIPFVVNSLTWPLTSAIKAANNPISSPLETPYINNTTYSQTNANAYLKSPLTGQKSKTAIDLSGIGNVINPTTTPTYYEIKIGINGSTLYNVFDNHSFCINAYDANITCINSIFQNTTTFGSHGTQGGIGINAVAKSTNRLMVVAGNFFNYAYYNKFFNCSKAVCSNNYFENVFTNCDIRSTQSTANNPYIFTNLPGSIGFNVSTDRYRVTNISSNKIYNITNPITFFGVFGDFNIGGTPYLSAQYSGRVDIVNNTIRPHLNGYAVTDQYILNAIRADNVLSSGIVVVPGTRIFISGNTITSASRGISCSNWQQKDLQTTSNTITLKEDPFFTTDQKFGISFTNNLPATTTGLAISSNTVTGYNTTNLYCKAIYTSLCTNGWVNCNVVTNTYEGLVFDGPQLVQTRYNTMSNHHYGFVLDNFGVIGTQGTPTEPCDNVYTQPYSTYWPAGSYFTATIGGSNPLNSIMYVRQTGNNANPDGYGTYVFPSPMPYAHSNGSLPYATGDFIGCGGGSSSSSSSSTDTDLSSAQAMTVQSLENLVSNQIDSANNTPETEFIAANQVYRLLKANPGLMNGSTVLQNFYSQSEASGKGLLKSIEDKLSEGDFTASRSMVASIEPQNAVETNYKTFYGLYLKYRTDSFDVADSTALIDIANACPFTNGAVVYQARALLNAIYSSSVVFSDNCQVSENKRLMQNSNKDESKKEDFDALVYPNPTTGTVFIAPVGLKCDNLKVKVTDLTGKEVYNNLLLITNGVCNFNLKIEPGIYFVKITDCSSDKKVIKKLIIQ